MRDGSSIPPVKSYSQEYSEIKKTRFWVDYCDKLIGLRKKIVKKILDPDTNLEKPCSYATILRDTHRFIGQILNIPNTMTGAENEKNEDGETY